MSEALDKVRQGQGVRNGSKVDVGRCSFANDFPLLFALLTETSGKQSGVQAGSLILVVEDGSWKVVVNDREMGKCAFVTGTTFNDLLSSAEKGLGEGTLDWRKSGRSSNGAYRTR